LDQHFPLIQGSHHDVTRYSINNQQLAVTTTAGTTGLIETSQCLGFNGQTETPTQVILKHHDLHVIIEIDEASQVVQTDKAGVKDLTLACIFHRNVKF